MTDNRTTELLPCPFCGGEADTQIFDKTLNVGCPRCDIRTRFMLHDDLEQAIAAWNTRHAETCENMREKFGYKRLFVCSECGVTFDPDCEINYCPSCGRKVVAIKQK